MKNKTLAIILGILLISISNISALEDLGIGKQNENFTINQVCNSATYITISTIQSPDKTISNINENMTFTGSGSFQYNLTASQTGRYDVCGVSDGCDNTFCVYFEITPNGKEFTQQTSISYVAFIIVLLFLFIISLYGALTIKWSHSRGRDNEVLSINNLRYVKVFLFTSCYLLLMFLFGLSYKLFNEAGLEGFDNFFYFLYTMFQALLIPILISTIIIWFIIFITNKKLLENIKLGV